MFRAHPVVQHVVLIIRMMLLTLHSQGQLKSLLVRPANVAVVVHIARVLNRINAFTRGAMQKKVAVAASWLKTICICMMVVAEPK